MAYANDVVFAMGKQKHPELDTNSWLYRRINHCDFWFGIEENMLEEWDGPICDYYEVVLPEEAIRRYEDYIIANPGTRARYLNTKPDIINKYEALLYDKRTGLVTYYQTDWESGLD